MTHASSKIAGLRSVALYVPDIAKAEAFYTQIWHLRVAARSSDGLYLRGTGADHHVLSLHPSTLPVQVRDVTLTARSGVVLDQVAACAPTAGATVVKAPQANPEPDGGHQVVIKDPDGRIFRVIYGAREHADCQPRTDHPTRLAHAVLNSHNADASQAFVEQVFDFSLADRTRIMAFMRCNDDHHSVAFGVTDNDALNHIAFLMPDLESVMRGGGRMRDAGYPIEWGPGRHGPGNNVFNYFVGPFGEVIEYTAEVQQVTDSYVARYPQDWQWPPGRVDQWGISSPPSQRLKQAQQNVFFQTVSF
jgi:catechol 2,3-dioxygenase-like lactoylglutathione lyase family enzyme